MLPDRTKNGGKCQIVNNSNATFFVIFKQCVVKEAQKRCLDNILMLHIYEMYKKFHHFIISQDTQDGQALKAEAASQSSLTFYWSMISPLN